jgi:hypothetical protein
MSKAWSSTPALQEKTVFFYKGFCGSLGDETYFRTVGKSSEEHCEGLLSFCDS